MEKLSPTTKELIYCKIKENEREILLKEKCIESSYEDSMNAEFIEFYHIEIEMLRKQIEDLKQLLFTK